MDLYEYCFVALFQAAVELAQENNQLKAEAKKAVEDITAEANGALAELAGIWRAHTEEVVESWSSHANDQDDKIGELKRDIANVEADHAIEVDALKSERDDVIAERDQLSRQLQSVRTAFEQLSRAVHPPKVGGGAGGGILGGYSVAYGDPRRALGHGVLGGAIVSGAGWDSIYDGRG